MPAPDSTGHGQNASDDKASADWLDRSDRPVRAVVTRLEDGAQADEVTLKHLLQACGMASFVPAMMVPALLVLSPLSGVPLFSSVCGITIFFIAAQMLLQREHLHIPDLITRQSVSGDKLRKGLQKLHKLADFLDRHTRVGRLRPLVGRHVRWFPQALCLIAGAMMPVLEIVPFSSSILGAAVLFFSVALLTRDGAFVLVGMGIMAAAALVPSFVISSVI